MQFSGFRSVVGSMWSVDDEVARQIVPAFYKNMIDNPGGLHCIRTAIALQKAVKKLRKKIPFEARAADCIDSHGCLVQHAACTVPSHTNQAPL